MSRVPEGPRHSGRTSRMLAEAVKLAKRRKYVTVYGNDETHTNVLRRALDNKYCRTKRQRESKWRMRMTFLTFTDIDGTLDHRRFGHAQWDWATAKMSRNTGVVHLVDHFALENRLQKVRQYLAVAATNTNPVQWMSHTAAMLAAQGTRVLVVSNSEAVHCDVVGACRGLYGRVDIMTSNEAQATAVNIRGLHLRNSAASPVLIFDPQMLHDLFDASIKEIDRWNK